MAVIDIKDNKNLYIGAYILNKCARTKKHIRQIKKASIDFMVCIDYSDKATLDLLAKCGIGAIVNGVFPPWWGSDGERGGQMAIANPMEDYEKCISAYTHHNAVWGIDIGDEISCRDFEHVNTILETHADFFGDKMMYMNLYPNYAVSITATEDERKKQWGCASYEEYIEKYCREISLPYICFDHYPYCHNDISMLVDNLKIVKQMADKYGKEVYLVAQSSSYDKNEFINCTQLRTQLYTALAFGVKVIMWACYTAGRWHNHVVDESGNTTSLYADIVSVNREIKRFYKKYSQYKCISTPEMKSDNSFIVCKLENLQNGKKNAMYVVNIGDGEFSFECKSKPRVYCMDKNCTVKYDKRFGKCTLSFASGYGAIVETN